MKADQARILLTGATGGIGQAAAQAFAAAGAQLLLTGRSDTALAALARRLPGARGAPVWVAADLCEAAQVQRLAAEAAAWNCNVVVHAAGLPAFGPLAGEPPERIAAVLQANLLAPMLLTRGLLPHLARQARAQVICVGSVLGAIGLPGYSVYGASKWGLRGFAQALRRELAGGPVRVQYLGPRTTRTAFNDARAQAYNEATGTATDSAATVAAALLRMLEEEAAERFLGWPERVGVRLNGIAPAAMDGSFRRHGRSLAQLQERTQG
jgi:short-subunit dehydrogenase